MPERTAVSAPGKVLIAGGYLVLDEAYRGVVVGTTSRFYCSVAPAQTGGRIIVTAAQFLDESWSYALDQSAQVVEEGDKRNKFVKITLETVFRVAKETLGVDEVLRRIGGDGQGLQIIVLGDNDFYSQRDQLASMGLSPSIEHLGSLTPFSPIPKPLSKANKTGLGSSAALVTSLVGALLSHLQLVHLGVGSDNEYVHSIAQFAHSLAQGKVGSGFDVSSAVFGTQLYRRFRAEGLKDALDGFTDPAFALLPHLKPSAATWNQEISAFTLPPRTRLLLADVHAGSDTPSLVGKVLAWRKSDPTNAERIWRALSASNEKVAELASKLGVQYERDPAAYDAAVHRLTGLSGSQWASVDVSDDATRLFIELKDTMESIRSLLREMSTASGVPIEPPEQTRLLDACVAREGVIGGGVPGAGGFDAIFILTFDAPEPVSRVGQVWQDWTEMSVCPLAASASTGGDGIRNVVIQDVPGLSQALDRVTDSK